MPPVGESKLGEEKGKRALEVQCRNSCTLVHAREREGEKIEEAAWQKVMRRIEA